MVYELILDKRAEDDLLSLDPSIAMKLVEQIEKKLCFYPLAFGEYLSGDLHPHHKLRIGEYRVVYRVQEEKKEVMVFVVGKRKDNEVYDLAMKRLWKS